jgi:2-desacetyl-2-hydroxyethyl bacteriochlorophyllide A dehydrogenase
MPTLAFSSPGEIDVFDVQIPKRRDGWAIVEVAYIGICGTDTHLLEGTSFYVQKGLTKYPIRFGHEWSGTVLAVGSNADKKWIGKRVTSDPFVSCGQCQICRGGRYNLCPERVELGVRGESAGAAAKYFTIPATSLRFIPDSVDMAEALMSEPGVTILGAFELAKIQPGEKVAVIGSGTLGLIALQVAVSMGCDVTTIGIDETGLSAALSMGASHACLPQDAPSDEFTVVIEASGSTKIGPMLSRITAIGGRIVQAGIPSGPVDGISLADFVSKGMTLSGVLGGVHLMNRALRLIEIGAIKPELLIEEILPFEDINEGFVRMKLPGRTHPKIILDLKGLRKINLHAATSYQGNKEGE